MFESVEIFRDKHKGKVGFVLGSGYSLTEHDINKIIKNGISFSCNSSIVSIDTCDYFIFTDEVNTYCNYYEKMANVSKNVIFAGRGINKKYYDNDINGYGEKINFIGSKYLIDRRYSNVGTPFLYNNDHNAANFNYNDDKLIDGSDVCHVASHLAYICGCDPIILIGVDLNYKNNEKYHESLSNTIMLQRNDSPHKYMDNISFFNKNELMNSDDHLLRSLQSWCKIKKFNPNLNIKNSNTNGLLNNIFETVCLTEYEK